MAGKIASSPKDAAAGGREQAILVDALIGAPEDVLPACPGDCERAFRAAAAAGLRGCARRARFRRIRLAFAVVLRRSWLDQARILEIPLRSEHEHGRGCHQ